MHVFVMEKTNFDHDFLIGLDCVEQFQLIQNENLKISQKEKKNEVKIPDCTGKTPQTK